MPLWGRPARNFQGDEGQEGLQFGYEGHEGQEGQAQGQGEGQGRSESKEQAEQGDRPESEDDVPHMQEGTEQPCSPLYSPVSEDGTG